MATPSSGVPAGFNPGDFRSAIRFAMQMGAAVDPDKRPKFIKKSSTKTYKKDGVQIATPARLDRDGRPLDPTIEMIVGDPEVVSVDCAVEVTRADADELPVGNFRPTKLTVTLLDEEYAQVKGFKELTYNGDRYLFGYEPETNGMFNVGIYTLIYYALDES